MVYFQDKYFKDWGVNDKMDDKSWIQGVTIGKT